MEIYNKKGKLIFKGKEWDLPGSILANADFKNRIYAHTNFMNIDFTNADLRGSSFYECIFNGSTFFRANLFEVNFLNSKMQNVDFRYAIMKGIKLFGVDLLDAELDHEIYFEHGSLNELQYYYDEIRIGEEYGNINIWEKNFKEYAEIKGYTENQIKEYQGYIQKFKTLREWKH